MKQLLVLLLLLCSMSVSAQDVIVKKDGSTIVCRVVEVTATEITYKKWSDLNGSNYIMDKSLAAAINYESGKKETFSQTESLYKPDNQNDGERAMNDKALLRLDAAVNRIPPKVKKLRTAGWIGGVLLTGIGAVCLIIAPSQYMEKSSYNNGGYDYRDQTYLAGGALVVGGCAWTYFLRAANRQMEKYQSQDISSTIYRHDIPFSNGSSLSIGADMLSDRTLGTNTVGLGLRYNF